MHVDLSNGNALLPLLLVGRDVDVGQGEPGRAPIHTVEHQYHGTACRHVSARGVILRLEDNLAGMPLAGQLLSARLIGAGQFGDPELGERLALERVGGNRQRLAAWNDGDGSLVASWCDADWDRDGSLAECAEWGALLGRSFGSFPDVTGVCEGFVTSVRCEPQDHLGTWRTADLGAVGQPSGRVNLWEPADAERLRIGVGPTLAEIRLDLERAVGAPLRIYLLWANSD